MAAATDDRTMLLARYQQGADELAAAVAGLSGPELDTGPLDGGWTIRQIVHHVADGDDLWALAVKMALGSDGLSFDLGWYWRAPQERWAESWRYATRPIEPSLALLRAQRDQVTQLLEAVPGSWEHAIAIAQPGRQPETVTVVEIIEMQTRHVYGHATDIRRIREARWP